MSAPRHVPSLFLLVPGPWSHVDEVKGALASVGVPAATMTDTPIAPGEVRVRMVRDPRLADGFAWGRYGRLPDEVLAKVAASHAAALLQVAVRLDEGAALVASIGHALRDAGGAAIRMEGSGAAWTWEAWDARMDRAEASDLSEIATVIVEGEDGTVFSCGMQHFDLPDAQIAMDDAEDATTWLDVFQAFQVAESPVLASGHTFAPDAGTARRVMERWPDHRHTPYDGRHNPFGLWRFLGAGETGIRPAQMAPVILPGLVAMLAGLERKAGRALTRKEVADIVQNSPTMAMDWKDALELERSRGYADLEPERAWEQWQIVRASM